MSEDNTGSNETKNKVMGKISEIKSNIESFIADVNVNDLKSSLNQMMKDAQKDFNGLVNKDLESMKAKLHKEKNDFEKKAKKFLEAHKKDLNTLQAKIDKLMKATKNSKVPAAKAPAASGTKKKVSKKVAKAVKKVSRK